MMPFNLGAPELIILLFVIVPLMALYFLPTIIAANKRKTNTGAIFAMNLLVGWIFIGWVVALVWALTHDKPATRHAQ